MAAADLTDPALHIDGPPHDLLAELREGEPVSWREDADGTGYWAVTRHADIAAASRDTETFSSHRDGIFLERDQVTPLELNRNLLLYKDPPEHTKYRKILQTAFVPHTVSAMEDSVRRRVTLVIDRVIDAGGCDFVTDIAVPIPLGVLAEMMGVPDEDVPKFHEWTTRIEAAAPPCREPNAAVPTFGEMASYLQERIAAGVDDGDSSLLARLRSAEVDGERLTDEEILVFFALLVFAGNDTTRNTASSGMRALLESPEQWQRLVADPELIPAAVEEILRHTSVVNWFCRTATRDTELGGQAIAEGDKVMLWYTSGSRDEAVCPHADSFDIDRGEQRHMAFGGGGRHFCLGAGLARLELRIIFEEVARRMPEISLAGPPEHLGSPWGNSLTSLPVKWPTPTS